MSTKQTELLNHLIDICEDGKNFYEAAIERSDDAEMDRTFKNMANIRREIITDLERCVRETGGEVERDGTAKGKISQLYGELKSMLSTKTDTTLVSRLEEAEDRSLEEFKDASTDSNLSADVQNVVNLSTQKLQQTHDHMKALKDGLKAA